jgi:hypothetical protein
MRHVQHIRPDLIETWEEEDDDPWEERDAGVETCCLDCGEERAGDACQCCGGPLCFMCAECAGGFCDGCLKLPDFAERMEEKTRGK